MNSENGEKLGLVNDIASDGDVILVVGEQKVALRTHSQFLICASKVFSVMLGPNWSEGKNLSKEFPKEVPLIEDDADALRTICCVIHHRNDIIPETFSPREVLRIAIVADKYDFHIALLYARAQWLQNKDITDPIELAYLMAAALLFDDMKMFIENGLALILQHEGSYINVFADPILGEIFGINTAYLLEERRNRMRAELMEIMLEEANSKCSCDCDIERSNRYKELSFNCSPLKMLGFPTSEIIEQIRSVDMERLYRAASEYDCFCYHEPEDNLKTLAEKVETAKKRVSICLDCVRSSDAAESCRFKHE